MGRSPVAQSGMSPVGWRPSLSHDNDGALVPFIADYYALEILQPRNDLPSSHRHLKAYPGISFAIRVAVVGGSYPYTYSLSNGGSGMTIDATTGVITWPNPQSNCTPTVTVTDVSSGSVQETWTITVTTSGFKFVDAVNGTAYPTGDGSLGNPWRTLEDIVEHATLGDMTYFRTGTYTWAGITLGDAGEEGVYLDVDTSTVWLAYPGESPVIDFQYSTVGSDESPQVWMNLNDAVYLDGFEIKDGYHKFFQMSNQFTVWRCELWGKAVSGVSNESFIMTGHGTFTDRYGIVIQDTVFRDGVGGTGLGYLTYDNIKQLVEDCEFTGMGQAVHHKSSAHDFTFRGNFLHAMETYLGLGGNMNADDADVYPTQGDVCYNNFLGPFNGGLTTPPYCCVMMGPTWIRTVGPVQFYRNTFNGFLEIGVGNVGDRALMTDNDGPFVWSQNVIVNSDTSDPSSGLGFTHFRAGDVGVVRWARMSESGNLKGVMADGIIDQATGLLQGAYRTQYLGQRGHEIP